MWAALDALLPPRCAGCQQPGWRWCPACIAACQRPAPGVCVLCGQAHPAEAGACRRAAHLDQAAAWGLHTDPLRKAIHRLKYKRDLGLGDALCAHLLALVPGLADAPEMVVPVPLAAGRLGERGYNQAALLARPLAYALGLAYAPGGLRRVRETASQVGLSLAKRRENVAGAFRASGALAGKGVLLVDDVLTTGATLDAAAEALKQAGARRVAAVVVSRAV